MSQRDIIHQYLKELEMYLARLEPEDANDVIREIESHIYDMLEQDDDAGNLESTMQRLGPARELAAGYVDHIVEGTPPPRGLNAIQKVKRGASRGLYYAMALFGFGIAGTLLLLAVAKLLYPQEIGLWIAEHGNSIIIGYANSDMPQSQEALGGFFMPVMLALAAAISYVTWRVLRVLKASTRKFERKPVA